MTSQIAVEYAKNNKILNKINGKFFAVGTLQEIMQKNI